MMTCFGARPYKQLCWNSFFNILILPTCLFSLPAAFLSRFLLQLSTTAETIAVRNNDHSTLMFLEMFSSFRTLLSCWIQTVSSRFCPQDLPVDPVSHTGTTRYSIQTRFLNIVRNKQQGGDQLTLWPLVSLEHFTLPKTNLTKQSKSLSKTCAPYQVCTMCFVDISELEKGTVFTMQSPLLQQSCNNYRPFL